MNNTRRKNIKDIISQMIDIRENIDIIHDEEQEYFENIPENLSTSRNYEISDNALELIQYSIDSLQEAIDNLEEAIGNN